MSDLTDRLDEIQRLADDVSPYDHGDLTAPLHDAVPELIAALRAVLARLDFADGTCRGVYGRSDGGAVWARDIRVAIAAALAPQERQP